MKKPNLKVNTHVFYITGKTELIDLHNILIIGVSTTRDDHLTLHSYCIEVYTVSHPSLKDLREFKQNIPKMNWEKHILYI